MKKTVIFLVLLVLTIPFSSAAVSVPIDKLFQTKEKPITETLSEEKTDGTTTYIYAGSKLLATKNNEEIKYHYQDRLGSDINSKQLPFGQEIYSGERFSFTGKELDEELYYFGARYYNPNLGKFTSVDPIKENKAYSYVNNNPLMFIDPTGKDDERIEFNLDNYENFESEFSTAASDPDGGTYYDPLNYGGGGYLSAYSNAAITGISLIAMGYGVVTLAPTTISFGIANPMSVPIVGSFIANAIDPDPTADYLPGVPLDDAGNAVGATARTPIVRRIINKILFKNTENVIEINTRIIRQPFKEGDNVVWKWVEDVPSNRKLGQTNPDQFNIMRTSSKKARGTADINYEGGVPNLKLFWERVIGKHSDKLR